LILFSTFKFSTSIHLHFSKNISLWQFSSNSSVNQEKSSVVIIFTLFFVFSIVNSFSKKYDNLQFDAHTSSIVIFSLEISFITFNNSFEIHSINS